MKVEMTAEAEERAIAILNTCMGRSERLLSEITHTELSIKVSDVSIHTVKEILESPDGTFGEISANLGVAFTGDISGLIGVTFPIDSAAKLVMALSGEDAGTPELDRLRIETLKEIGSIIITGIMGSVGSTLHSHMDYSIPYYEKGSIVSLLNIGDKALDYFVKATTVRISLKDLQIEGRIFMVLEESQVRILLKKIKENLC